MTHSGLALAGAILQRSRLWDQLGAIRLGEPKRPELSHGDVLLSIKKRDGYALNFAYLGLAAYNVLRLCGQQALTTERAMATLNAIDGIEKGESVEYEVIPL